MKKILTGIVAAVAFALPVAAFASVNISNVLFDNGSGNVSASSGSSIPVHLYVNTSGSNDVESVFVKFPGAGGQAQNGVCYDVTDQVGASPVNGWIIDFDVTVPTNSGVWPIEISTHGTNGDDADQGCFTSADTTNTFNGRVTVTADNSSGNPTQNSGGNNNTSGSSNQTKLEQLIAQVSCVLGGNVWNGATMSCGPKVTPPPAPTGNQAKCDQARPYLGAQPYAYSSVGVQLQSVLLLDNPSSIPALHAGATIPMGYFGPQTHAALTNFSSMYQCGFIFN